MVRNMPTIGMSGTSAGSVMLRNFCHAVAPSTEAASWSWRSIVCICARRTTSMKGKFFQTLPRITAGIAQSSEPNGDAGKGSPSVRIQ